MPERTDWEEKAKAILRVEMARKGLTYALASATPDGEGPVGALSVHAEIARTAISSRQNWHNGLASEKRFMKHLSMTTAR